MQDLFKIIVLALGLIPIQSLAQGFSDIIKIEEEYYFISPSLSIKQDDSSMYVYEEDEEPLSLFSTEYEYKDSIVQLNQVFKSDEDKDAVLKQHPNGRYALFQIQDIERTRKELTQLKGDYIELRYVEFFFM